jgi:hypothetical protein
MAKNRKRDFIPQNIDIREDLKIERSLMEIPPPRRDGERLKRLGVFESRKDYEARCSEEWDST